MSYNELMTLIDACVNRNGVHAITGRILNGVLKAMVQQLGAGFTLGGMVSPTDDPGTPDAPICYFASEVGTYTNFGGLTIAPGEFALFCYDLTDGWYKETIYEGFQSVQANVDDQVGTPEVDVTYNNGVLAFDFRNMKGNTGDPAGFGAITATVDDQIGTPAVSVTSSGPDTEKVISFAFRNLKGETGVTSAVVTVDNTIGTPSCAVSLVGQELHLDFTGLKGAQGDTGVSADYPIAIVNNLTTNDPAQALSAAMGVQLESEVSQLELKVDDFEDAVLEQIEDYKPIVIEGDVTNAPDEEDITTDENNLLKFANRSALYGKGYTILRRGDTFAEQVVLLNTIYEIRYNFDLNGETVNIPSGCTLRFNGGSISNGTIVYDNTEIQGMPIIDCICTGKLRNTVVTPQMYGAKGDGVTDDNVALANAAKYNDCIFIPAGIYITTEPIKMRSNMTLYGVGKESVIRNTVSYGANKVCIFTGGMQVGTNTGSFLNLTAYACTVSSDRKSILVSDTSPFKVGDLIFVCKDEAYTTKNPPRFWNGKVVSITENVSLELDYYMGNDDLVGVSCLVRDLAVLPQGGGYYEDVLTENICIHDLTVENSVDADSGMYVLSLGTYGIEIYNIWSHGNTIIGSNYLVNARISNITAEFDGSFADIPEINQKVEICGCDVKRFGTRQNVLGLSMLQGLGAYIHNNRIDLGGHGKIGFGQHIRPIIKENVFENIAPSSGRPIELSSFGSSILDGNYISTPVSTSVINLFGTTENIVKNNHIVNPNTARWLEGFTTLDFGSNLIVGNTLSKTTTSDAYYNSFPNTRISSFIRSAGPSGTSTIASAGTTTILDTPLRIYNARAIRMTILLSTGSYTITVASSGYTTNFTIVNGGYAEIYVFGSSNYINIRTDGDNAGNQRKAFNSHGKITSVTIKNDGESDASLYAYCIEDIIP